MSNDNSNKPPNQVPPGQEFTEWRDFLVNVQGYTVQEAVKAIGPSTLGRTRAQIANDQIGWLRGV